MECTSEDSFTSWEYIHFEREASCNILRQKGRQHLLSGLKKVVERSRKCRVEKVEVSSLLIY